MKTLKSVQQYQKAFTETNKTRIQPLIDKMKRHDEMIEANMGPIGKDVKRFLDSITPEQMQAYNQQIAAACKH